jgi:hypothetical protein
MREYTKNISGGSYFSLVYISERIYNISQMKHGAAGQERTRETAAKGRRKYRDRATTPHG